MKKVDSLAYKYGVSFIKHEKKALAVLLFSAVALLTLSSALGYSVRGARQMRKLFFGEKLSQ